LLGLAPRAGVRGGGGWGGGGGARARRAPRHVEFTGRLPDAELPALFARCRALVQPQEEDFGLTAVEVQAAGRPVVAFGRGGAVDSVVPLVGPPDAAHRSTGVFFDEQTSESLLRALHRFEAAEPFFDAKAIRSHAERFSAPRFRTEIEREAIRLLEAHGAPGTAP